MIDVFDIPISDVIPYTFNNKVHTPTQIDRIANSIALFGFNQPIVIDEANIILVGHGRYEAAKKLKLATVPVVRKLTLTETEKKAYRIIDNKTASDTSYDLNNLQLEVRALEEMGFDAAPFAFEEFKFPEPPPPEDAPTTSTEPAEWVGQIKLRVPAEHIDNFEAELDALMGRYNNEITKETKRHK